MSHDLDDRYPEGGEAVHHGSPDLELGDLTVEIPRGQALARQVHAVHLAFATLLLVIAPGLQISARNVPSTPLPYTAAARRGGDRYAALGCVYCHSQQPRSADQAPDGEQGWGRPSAASDYAYDMPHQLGTMRTGPDLPNVGARLPSGA